MYVMVIGAGRHRGSRFIAEVMQVTKHRITCLYKGERLWYMRRNGRWLNTAGNSDYYEICPADLLRIESAYKNADTKEESDARGSE